MKICINAICKDELHNLIDGVNTLKDADYIAILDTGSTDGTWEKLQKYQKAEPERFFISQKIFNPFYFDEARNAAMELVPADADVVLVLDLDERINSNWRNAFLQVEDANIYRIWRRDVSGASQGRYAQLVRVFKNNNTAKGYKHIHETLGEIIRGTAYQNFPTLNIYLDHFEDNDPKKGAWYNKLLEQNITLTDDFESNCHIMANLENLAYQNFLLHNYQQAGIYIQQAKYLHDTTPADIRIKYDWEYSYWWVNACGEEYKLMAEKKIAVYAICKNELKFVDAWVKSMSDANYICILDTGSTDGTYEKLLEYQEKYPAQFRVAQKVITPWRFDVARNESLKLVPEDTDIYFCTDLDELLDAGWSKPLREKWIPGKHTRATYKYVWSHLENGQPGRVFNYNKIHDKNWEWRYPVHELLYHKTNHTENYAANESLNLFNEITLQHYPDKLKSRGSYLGLLELREQEYTDDLYGLLYLAHEYRYRGFLQKSIDKLNKILATYSANLGLLEKASCYLFLGDNYKDLKQYDMAIVSYLNGINADPTYRECYVNLGNVFIIQKQYGLAIDIIRQGLSKSYRHYSWLERDTSWSYEPYDLLCLAYYYSDDKLKSLGCAYKALQFEPENKRLQTNVKQVIDTMTEKDY